MVYAQTTLPLRIVYDIVNHSWSRRLIWSNPRNRLSQAYADLRSILVVSDPGDIPSETIHRSPPDGAYQDRMLWVAHAKYKYNVIVNLSKSLVSATRKNRPNDSISGYGHLGRRMPPYTDDGTVIQAVEKIILRWDTMRWPKSMDCAGPTLLPLNKMIRNEYLHYLNRHAVIIMTVKSYLHCAQEEAFWENHIRVGSISSITIRVEQDIGRSQKKASQLVLLIKRLTGAREIRLRLGWISFTRDMFVKAVLTEEVVACLPLLKLVTVSNYGDILFRFVITEDSAGVRKVKADENDA